MYPVDTLKTQIQSYTAASAESAGTHSSSSMMGALRHHFQAKNTSNSAAFARLWRGVQAMVLGCIPAHAMYFSSYEGIKEFFLYRQEGDSKNLGAFGSSVAGATAALSHDAGK